MYHRQVDWMALVALAFIAFIVFNVVRDRMGADRPSTGEVSLAASSSAIAPQEETPVSVDVIAAPYDHYTLTQGPHGQKYGQLAIDIAAGKGAVIKSPIDGVVTALYVDEWGNTTLVIENEHYQVTLLHGIYKVEIGEEVALGQPVGKESNQGNTVDAAGKSCRGRDCGYHTHLNIYDKRLGANVNPLDLFGK